MLLDDLIDPVVGVGLLEALSITPDVVFDITVEGNRPDAWSVEGVARDLATRLGRPLASPPLAEPNGDIDERHIRRRRHRRPRPLRSTHRLGLSPGRRSVLHRRGSSRVCRAPVCDAISNVVDASNLVMLELGQPTHAYDAHPRRRDGPCARDGRDRGETLETLDGVVRELADRRARTR